MRRALLGLLCTLPFLFTSSVFAERLPLKTYTVADGLAHNTINCVVRDARGFLWFCTAEGLSLFDGYAFTNYGVDQGLPHPFVSDILQTRDGEYWVATDDGLCKFDPKGAPSGLAAGPRTHVAVRAKCTIVRPDSTDLQASGFTKLLQGRDGTIWCGTRNGLRRLARAGRVIELQPVDIALPAAYPEERFITTLLEDRSGTLWVGALSGLYRRWPDGSAARYSEASGFPDNGVHALLEDRANSLWVGTRRAGLLRLSIDAGHHPPTVAQAYNRANGFIADWIFDLHQSADGRLWVGANTGLAEFSADDRQRAHPEHVYSKENGFIYHEIAVVSEDRDGNVWLGTVNGAMKLARNGFVTFGESDGIVTATPLFEVASREMYFGGYPIGDERAKRSNAGTSEPLAADPPQYSFSIGRFDGQRFTWVRPRATEGQNISWSDKRFVTRTRAGDWWIGRFLFRVKSFADLKTARPIAEYGTGDGLASPVVYSVFEDSRGDVWISTMAATGNGLARWERGVRTVRDMGHREGLTLVRTRLPSAFEEDRAGGVWIGFEQGGLARYSDDRFRVFTTQDGLPDGTISDLHLDGVGRLWVGTSHSGLARVDDPAGARPAFAAYSTAQGLSSNTVTAVTEDSYGRIYVATGRGLDRLSPNTGHVRHFTSADGLAAGEIRSALRDRDGTLWFGTRSGLLRYVPESELPAPPPSVFITGLNIAGKRQAISALGETDITLADLDPDRNQVQLNFVALSFAPGETLRYEYQLEPSHDWSAPTDQRTINLANLAPGKYRFVIRAVTSDGIPSPAPAMVSFTVLAPVWQRWWFRSLAVVACGLIVHLLYRYRLSRLLELERVRTRIATDLHDEIGSNLSLIAMVSDVAGRAAKEADSHVAERLSLIARTSRETVDAMSDIVWMVNPKRDRIGDLTQRMRRVADDACSAADIALQFIAPADESEMKLGVDTRREIFMIFKEAVHNIVRHSRCTRARIELTVESTRLQLQVSDNGRGFDVTAASSGNGLVSMRRRAEQVDGTFDIVAGASGTTITVRAPLAGSRVKS